MPMRKFLLALGAGALLFAPAGFAQAPAPGQTATAPAVKAAVPDGGEPAYIRPESPDQRRQRLGTSDDPGVDPDPKTHFWRFGQSFHIEKFDRRWTAFDSEDKAYVRPFSFANVAFELYQQNEKFIWVWVPDKLTEPPVKQAEAVAPQDPYNDATYEFLKRVRPQFSNLEPPKSTTTIHFRESSKGLPDKGSWRESLAVADMNGDGCPDLVAPPERKGNGVPAIFLGDCKGNWKYWAEARFPQRMDYGSVVTADFNKDGHMDMAVAVHLNGMFVLLGDGKGKFTDVVEGVPHDFPTRRAVVADLDRDGYPDIVLLNEGPSEFSSKPGVGPVRAFLNRKKGTEWKAANVAAADVRVGGDWMTTGDFNGDGYPDFAVASVYYGTTDVVYLSSPKKTWAPLATDGDLIPSLSYYFANASGKFTSKKHDDAIISYVRFWPQGVNTDRVPKPELLDVDSVDLLRFDNGKATRIPLARWSGRAILALGAGDFDHDGNLDVIFLKDKPREAVILLGDGNGDFKSATVDGIDLQQNPIYDIRVADVNNDGRPDVILMYESGAKTTFAERDGAIRVFLNTGNENAVPPNVAKK